MADKKKAIKKIPTIAVTNLGSMKVTKSGTNKYLNVSASWKYPANAFKDSREDRFEGVVVEYQMDTNGVDNSWDKIKNNRKKNASIGGVSGPKKTMHTEGSKATSKSWPHIRRSDYYPCANTAKEQKVKQVKIYKLTKDAVWSKSQKKWVPAKKGVTAGSFMNKTVVEKKYKSWKNYWSKQPQSKKPKKGTIYYKDKLTTKGQTRTVSIKPDEAKPRVDGIAVTVQGWNSISNKNITYNYVKKPAANPSKAGYYYKKKNEDKSKNPPKVTYSWTKATETKKESKRKYYKRVVSPKLVNTIPRQIAYFNFKPPDNPKVTRKVGGDGTNHTLEYTFKVTLDKSNAKERYDTHYESYYQRGLRDGTSRKFTVSGKNKITSMSKDRVDKDFTLKFNPNDYLIKDPSKEFNSKTNPHLKYISTLDEGEWLRFWVYYYDRGIAGPSVSMDTKNAKGKVTKKDTGSAKYPSVDQMKVESFLYAWPYETAITSIERQGQHYMIKFKTLDTVKNETRRTDKYTLQRLANFRPDGDDVEQWSALQWAAAASAASGWQNVSSAGSGERGFMDNVRDAAFEPSHRTYYRVVSESTIAGIPHLYSEVKVVRGYASIANVADQSCEIIEAQSVDDGQALHVYVGFKKTSNQYITVQDPPSDPSNPTNAKGTKDDPKYPLYELKTDPKRYDETTDTYPVNGKTYYEQVSEDVSPNSNGTEISWAPKLYMWKSDKKPSTHDIYDTDQKPAEKVKARNELKAKRPKEVDMFPKWNNGTAGLNYVHELYITDVKPGESYYVRARRFLKGTDTTVGDQYAGYGEFIVNNAITPVNIQSRPRKVKLATSSPFVPYSEDTSVDVTWSYDEIGWTSSEAYASEPQSEYAIFYMPTDSEKGRVVPKELLHGTDSATYTTIPFSKLKDKLQPYKPSESRTFSVAYLAVRVKVGEVWSDLSNTVAVVFVTAPTASLVSPVGTSKILDKLPLTVKLGTNDTQADAVVRITCLDTCSTWEPYGKDIQPSGTIVYSRKYHPAWDSSTTKNGITWTTWDSKGLDLDLREGGHYRFDFMLTTTYTDADNLNDDFDLYDEAYASMLQQDYDSEGNYNGNIELPNAWSSAMNYTYGENEFPFTSAGYNKDGVRVLAGFDFYAKWKHDAVPMPNHTGRGGVSADRCIFPPKIVNQGVQFTIPQLWPGASANDVIDMYRVTPDGAYLVKTDLKPGDIVTDTKFMYSNYANCRYRFATRTSEGATDWVDVISGAKGHCVRFDWGDEAAESHGGYSHLELPYNLKWTDQWTKNARIQLHMDGTYSGYWRGGVDRKNTLTTELLKFEDPEQVERVKALAKYSGPVFVRLPDGCAFCANVDVNSLENSYDSLTLTASFNAQELAMIPQYSSESIMVTRPSES